MRIVLLLLIFIMCSCKNETNNAVVTTKIEEPKTEQTIDLEIYDYDGLETYLTTSSDTTYVVNFWATWCAPCVKELPYFEELNSKYVSKKVVVILVSLDFPKAYETKLKPFILKRNLKSKVIALNDVDSNMWIPKINESWSGAIPATLIYNKNKRQFYEQSFTYEELENEVKQFLK